MKNNTVNRMVIAFMCCALALPICHTSCIGLTAKADTENNVSATESNGDTYSSFLAKYSNSNTPKDTFIIHGDEYIKELSSDLELTEDENGEKRAVITDEGDTAVWSVSTKQAGLYNFAIMYRPETGKGSDIIRNILINGVTPYSDLKSQVFTRSYKNSTNTWETDKNGNQIKPDQIEVREYKEQLIKGSTYNSGVVLQIYLKEGNNTVSLVSEKEIMSVSYIKIFQSEYIPPYEEISADYSNLSGDGTLDIYIDAEKADMKSSTTLYPLCDRSSPMTEPSDISRIMLNTIGGENWKTAGQWMEWKVNVKKTGLYRLSMRCKQNYESDIYCNRILYLDGKIPFKEASCISFPYANGWQIYTLGGNEPYLFYLTKGEHILRLEATVGEIGSLLEECSLCVSELNKAYRKIMMITGTYPDSDRDYELDKKAPEAISILTKQLEELKRLESELLTVTGEKGKGYSKLQKLEIQLEGFLDDVETIPARLDNFRTNISDLSSWILSSQEQPLLLDAIYLTGTASDNPKADSGFFSKLIYEIKALAYSFVTDYTQFADDGTAERSVTLWLGSQIGQISAGRDQAQIFKDLSDNSFTPKSGISVNIKLVDMSTLLPAVSSGRGPDVTIGNARTMPMDYAYRNALVDLSQFDDLPEVLERFSDEAITAFRHDSSVYALPDTYTFYMMFYRTDIFEELGLSIPKTWNEVYELIPQLQNNNMDLGLPNISGVDNADIFYTLLFQAGGSVYNDKMTSALLDSEEAIGAFRKWTDFYTKYNLSQKMDHLTRFRTGEVPLVFMPYTFYNNIEASAPEIKGSWDFAPMPGTVDENGQINNICFASGTGSVIFSTSEDKEAAWEFLKWWTSADIQTEYGLSIENLQGSAGRYATANREAFERLPWTNRNIAEIGNQWELTKGLEEAPGGYITTRYLSTAIRLVVNNSLIARETLLDYSKLINDEIKAKCNEFGLAE